MTTTFSAAGELKFAPERLFREEYLGFVCDLLDRVGVPPLPAAERDAILRGLLTELSCTPQETPAMLDIAMQDPIKLIVNARGSRPAELAADTRHYIRHGAIAARGGCSRTLAGA